MHIFSKINLRRIFAICLISITLFIGSAISIGHQNQAYAEVIKPDTQEKPLRGDEYESIKANRNRLQAERSKLADDENDSEDVKEKLNLDEITPPAIPNPLEDNN
jgi:cell division protein FtsB